MYFFKVFPLFYYTEFVSVRDAGGLPAIPGHCFFTQKLIFSSANNKLYCAIQLHPPKKNGIFLPRGIDTTWTFDEIIGHYEWGRM